MIWSIFAQYLTHLRMLSKAALTTPTTLLVLLLFGSMSIMFWPVDWSTSYSVVERPSPFDMSARLGILWLMWLYMWPMVPALSCRGRATGGGACNPLATVASPALPISRGTRAFAEATLVLLVTAALRIVGLLCAAAFYVSQPRRRRCSCYGPDDGTGSPNEPTPHSRRQHSVGCSCRSHGRTGNDFPRKRLPD